MNHPFLPLLQMSESETLITMVNHMVENSSPRAQLFMQVRPQSDSMGLQRRSCWLCMLQLASLGSGVGSLHPTCSSTRPHHPDSAWPPSILHDHEGNPRLVSQTIQTTGHLMSCQGLQICFLMSWTSVSYFDIFLKDIIGLQGMSICVLWNQPETKLCRMFCGCVYITKAKQYSPDLEILQA